MSEIRVDTISEKTSGSGTTVSNLKNPGSLGRNLIINGDMSIFQRATATTTATSGNYTTVDRFLFYESTDGVYSTEKEDLSAADQATTGQRTALQCDVTTADGTIGAAQFAAIYQRIEAQMLQHLHYGTSAAKNLTLSFWVKSNKTGTYCVAIVKDDSTAYYLPIEYTISSANTWEKKVINISPTAGSTSLITGANGAITDDNGIGLFIWWTLAAGSDFQGTNNTWTSSEKYTTSDQVNWLDSTSNNFHITGIQLEIGDAATDFEYLPHDINLLRCQRYYFQITPAQYDPMTIGASNGTDNCISHIFFPVEMRGDTSLGTSGTASDYVIYEAGTVHTCSAVPQANTINNLGMRMIFASDGNLAAGNAAENLPYNTSALLKFNAEL